MSAGVPPLETYPVPELVQDGILLRPWRDDDVSTVRALADEPVGRQWSPSLRTVLTDEDALAWMRRRRGAGRVDWAVCDAVTGEVVGRTGLHGIGDKGRNAEIGYGVMAGRRREGVATRAVRAATAYAFGQLGLARLSLIHAVGNPASCAVATRCGFANEGTERGALDHGDGILHDVHRHARLATDPPGPADPVPMPLEVPDIAGLGVRLRAWTRSAADRAAWLRGRQDPDVARWFSAGPVDEAGATLAMSRNLARAAAGGQLWWAVEEEGRPGVVVGSFALRDVDSADRWATASYWVLPEARGRAVATRSLAAAASYAFDRLDLHRVQLQHAVGNTASCVVAERAGFALEGVQRGSNLLAVGFVDEHLHALVRGDVRPS